MLEIELTDPATGLMNRREMERRIAERKAQGGEMPPLLVFDLLIDLPGDIAKQVATRLASQLRYQDLICRWTSRQFLVMFQGVPETAEARAEQILPWIAGRYLRDNGSRIELNAQFRMVGPEIVNAPETEAPAPSFVL